MTFHSIRRKIEKHDLSGRVVLEMNYDDVADLAHILWESRKKDMLKSENEKLLQLQFQNLRNLMVDGVLCDVFEVCSMHERLEEMGIGDEKQGFSKWHEVEQGDLPKDTAQKFVMLLDGSYDVDTFENGTWHNHGNVVKKWRTTD